MPKVLTASLINRDRLGDLRKKSCVYLVSVGKTNFEDDAVTAVADLINTSCFKECLILVAGTLQRYNIAAIEDISPDEAYVKAQVLEEAWITKYADILKQKITIPYVVRRWADLTSTQAFNEQKQQVDTLVTHNVPFQQVMGKSVNDFLKRNEKHYATAIFDKSQERLAIYSRDFLAEECAVITLLALQNWGYIVYPGKTVEVLEAVQEHLLPPHTKQIQWVTIRLKHIEAKPTIGADAVVFFKSCKEETKSCELISAIVLMQLSSIITQLPPAEQQKCAKTITGYLQQYITQNPIVKMPSEPQAPNNSIS